MCAAMRKRPERATLRSAQQDYFAATRCAFTGSSAELGGLLAQACLLLCVDGEQHTLQGVDSRIDLLALDHQRGSQAHHRVVGVLGEHAFAHQSLADLARTGERRVDLHANQQAAATHVGDGRVLQACLLYTSPSPRD